MTIVAYGYGNDVDRGPVVQPSSQIINRYVSMRNQQTIYKLKRLYGGSIFVYTQGTKTADLKTGEITWTGRVAHTVSRAIILPVKIDRQQVQSISMISSNKQFVYGGTYDRGARWFYIDPKDLPIGHEIKMDDWIVYQGKKYEIKTTKDSEFDSLWEVLGVEMIGVKPEQVFNLTAYNIVDFQQTAQGVL